MLVGFCMWLLLTGYLVVTVYSVGKENTYLVKENEELEEALSELSIETPPEVSYVPLELVDNFKQILIDYMLSLIHI